MSPTDHAQDAPRMVDPGAEGWADEPKVTQGERLLYGDLAGAVRRFGDAAVAAQDAYSLTCKYVNQYEAMVPESVPAKGTMREAAYRELIQVSWQVYENARAVHREVAAKAGALMRANEPDQSVPAHA